MPNERLLLAIDGSVQADAAAEFLASWASALKLSEVILVHAIEAETFSERATGIGETAEELAELGMRVTRTARRILDTAGIRHRLDTKLGNPVDVILDTMANEHIDEAVMGTRGMSPWQGLFVGSVAYKVIHRASVPITIVGIPPVELARPRASAGSVSRILLAIDGSAHSMSTTQYLCRWLAAGMRFHVDLLNVPVPVASPNVRRFLNQGVIDSFYQEEGERALSEASRALSTAGIGFDRHIVAGRAADQIVQLAIQQRCDRIVMGTRGLGAAAGLALGSVAYQVAHLSPVPLTLVK